MNDVHYSSETDLWATPKEFFDALDREFGFDLDVCALASNAKCQKFFTPQENGLVQEWHGVCWMNPPYGKEIGDWVRKAHESSRVGCVCVCVWCRAELIPLGGTSTLCEPPKFGLFVDGLDSAIPKRARHSLRLS